MSFEHQFPYGDVNELNLDWIIQTIQEFINSEREAGHTPTVSGVKSFFTHKYPYGSIHELNLDWVIQTALRMEEIGDSVEGDIGALQTRMTAAEGNISTLDNTVSGLSDSVEQIETEIGNINDDVGALETTSAQHTAQIAALDDKIDTQVVANPAGAATDTLNKIEIAGAVYGVEGSGGSEVEANPTDEPTDTLETIGIDGTVYEVGGSAPVSKTATGNPIHIEDAADAPIVSGEVTFEPKQDLHGYDKPWVGGAGKNKLPMTVDGIKAANPSVTWNGNSTTINGITYTIQADADNNVTGIKLDGSASSSGGINLCSNEDFLPIGNYILTDGSNDPSNSANVTLFKNNSWFGSTASDGVLNVSSEGTDTFYAQVYVNANAGTLSSYMFYPMIRLATETDPTFEPYSNICPIKGYTDCEVEVTGKNLLVDSGYTQGVLGWNESTADGITAAYSFISSPYIHIKDNTAYTITAGKGIIVRIYVTDAEHNTLYFRGNNPVEGASEIIPAISGAVYLRISMGLVNESVTPSDYGTKVYGQLEKGSTATPYEPYKSTTYTIDLDGTRYGGTVDLVSGVMTVDRGYAVFDGSSDEDWNVSSNRFVGTLPSPTISDNTNVNISFCNTYEGKNMGTLYANRRTAGWTGVAGSSTSVYVVDNVTFPSTKDATAWRTYLASNPLQIVYELATPFTVQLTPEQIRTLEGTNNISTNMTNMSLEYITQDYQSLVKLIERSAGHHYSTQERVVGTWFGKPLYEKVVDFGALPNATTKDLNHNIADIDTVFIVGGYAKNTTSGFVQQLNVPVPSNNQTDMQSQWYFGVCATYIRCFTLTDRTSYDECKVILQYTKTTD